MVGRPDIQSFVGAMHGRASKGGFMTTSDFTEEARDYADRLQNICVRRVNTAELVALMVDIELGVNREQTFVTYRVNGISSRRESEREA